MVTIPLQAGGIVSFIAGTLMKGLVIATADIASRIRTWLFVRSRWYSGGYIWQVLEPHFRGEEILC